MSEQQVRVTFEPNGRAVYVLPGTMIVEAAGRAGLTLDTPCGGQGTCGKCRVQITRGACPATDHDREVFSDEELADGWRLACQTSICQECVVQVPDSSLFASHHQILIEVQTAEAEDVLPAVRKVYVELPEPTLAAAAADLERLEDALGPLKADLPLLRKLPRVLRDNDYKGTAVLTDHRLIAFEPGDTSRDCHGVAFDLGTTTVAASLLRLCDGEELAIASRMNPQVSFGDDVLSRIQHAGDSAAGLDALRNTILKAMREMIDEVCIEAKVHRDTVYEIAVSGNTTMEHLLCGMDVRQLGQVPFVPAFARGLLVPAAELGVAIAPRGAAYIFPVIGGFVGGDTVAGILSARLTELESPVLMVDIGTNGEIVLVHDGEILASSTAAGPAFEGARITCGMRATRGAIEKVVFGEDGLRLSVIGNAPPIGLCGSGLIDLAAECLRAGIVSEVGRLLPPDELPESAPEWLAERVSLGSDGKVELLLAAGSGAARDSRVVLTERDVRELQLATGAIRAGVRILCKQAGVKTGDLKLVLIAGGFGSFIRRSNAQRIGLLPEDVGRERIHYVGNTSLKGSRWALVSTPARKRAEEFARRARHVELSQDMDFQMEFAEAMIFPAE